jgi:small-conductance mechanosensitive channel/CRP-like cAMP-binding protein
MPTTSPQRRVFLYVAFTGAIILILILLPFFESLYQSYLTSQFGISIGADGKVIAIDGTTPGMMTETSVALVDNLIHLLKIFLWMALVILIVRFSVLLIFEHLLKRSGQSEIASLLKTVLSVIIYIVAFFIIFQSQYPGVQLAPLFTGSAILGIVVGLALQDTLGNLFAGIALQADQPFQVGDVVSISNRGSGVVESVTWRGVKIRTFQNKLIVMSNAVLGKETFEVAPRENLNARLVFFNTLYSNSPSKTIQVVREAVRHVENVSQKMRPIVRIRDLADNGIDWEVKYWCDDYRRYNETDALIRQRIWYAFNREKIDFAFPTRTVHIEPKPEETAAEDMIVAAADQLSRIELFTPLSEDELQSLAGGASSRVFAPGEAIVRKGQEGKSMFVIVRGSVKVQIPDRYGWKTINTLSTNDFFGEMGLLTGEPRTANVIAEEETEVLQIRKATIKPIFEANPSLMEAISAIIEERRELLKTDDTKEAESDLPEGKGVLRSLKKFFGIK